ncbi:hydrogenobyrinic acid a,c-diamide synthase (glutamine-hydrolysing) /cobyrinate a,c-diamide synthase [Candidatus Nitrososphaera evergladensis SR1]|uniref:Cobyrinate a,c-diamide synthase n=1 Tax=Candidatus Nitrososphaera evergladensis SR1 TaxID=1459636 RepID=A0A075MRS7_9ARCH|nr:cobyrinate a,c-diamide synthase [Candidatus Nitrososphaera evergladensis]AIF83795.1 hydrogenobyrinic acid a,c-diamide synthase (glutamine-hydrolysing) /cobyrinate a,c-diamide synthase [Candidatus Nitrososphaera evergladensis SR1]
MATVAVPRIVVAGVTSGVGKTTVAVAIMHTLRKKKGLAVQPFKVGPDFIDPSYHTFVTGRKSRNLDVWLMGRQGVIDCFNSACESADVAVIEGVMGLFDGMSGKDNFASTAHVAKILGAPVVLVVDASKSARSIAAIALGFTHFDRSVRIAGIILNNVASDRHAGYLSEALAGKVRRVPVLGVIRRNSEIKMDERHLGLVPAQELQKKKRAAILDAAKYVSEQIDIDSILKACGTGPLPASSSAMKKAPKKKATTIAVALDESFNFYYADNLDALRRAGARLVFFSPVNDARLPEGIDGVMLGGGFPEVLADKLEKNRPMIKSVAKAVNAGMPVYGECGGLMYLTRSISGYKGEKKTRRMAGLIDADTVMTSRLTLNYTEADCDGPVFGRANLRGHEFHYSAIEDISRDSRFAYAMKKGKGVTDGRDGFVIGETGLAAYMHLHFASKNNVLAERLVRSCASYLRR